MTADLGELERLARTADKSLSGGTASAKVVAQTLRDGHSLQTPRFTGPMTFDEDAAYMVAACAALPALISRLRAAERALERLASSEAFDLPMVIDGPLAEEMRQRMDFARAALSVTNGGGTTEP